MTQDQINELAEIYRAALDEPHHGPCELCEKKEQAFRWKLATLAAPEGEEYEVSVLEGEGTEYLGVCFEYGRTEYEPGDRVRVTRVAP